MAPKIQFTDQELACLYALAADKESINQLLKFKEVQELDGPAIHPLIIKHKNTLHAIAKKCATRTRLTTQSNYKISESVLDLWNNISAFVMIMDSFFTLATAITLTGFLVVGSIFTVLLGLAGGLYFMSAYQERKQKAEEDSQRYELLALQLICMHAHLNKNNPTAEQAKDKKDNDDLSGCFEIEKNNKPKQPDKKKWRKLKDSVFAVVLTTSTLFYTYYAFALGLSLVLSSTAIVAAMVGPIGLGIVLLGCVAIGIVMGYKKYQYYNQQDKLKNQRKEIENIFDEKKEQYQAHHDRPVANGAALDAGVSLRETASPKPAPLVTAVPPLDVLPLWHSSQ